MIWPIAVALAASLLNGVIGALAYLRSRGASIYRSLAVLGFSFSFWSIAYVRCWPEFDDPLWMRILFTPLAWLPAATLSFVSSYTGVPDLERRWRSWPLYGAAAAALALLWSGWLGIDQFRLGFVVLAFPVFAYGMALLFFHWRRAQDPDERNRRGYLLAASLIAVAGGLTDFLPKLGAPVLPLANPGLMLYSLIVLKAINDNHLMDLREAAGQAGALLAVCSSAAAFLTALAWLTRQVEGSLFLNFFVLNLALLLVIPPIWERMNRAFTRWLFARQSRRERALDELERRLEGVGDSGVIAAEAVALVQEAWGTSAELLWIPRALRGLPAGSPMPEGLRQALALDPAPVTVAGARRQHAPAAPGGPGPLGPTPGTAGSGTVPAGRALIAELEVRRAQAAVPVLREGELVAALLMGRPASGFFDLAALRSLRRLGAVLGRAVRSAEAAAGLLHADRLAQLGTLSAGIAHEIRNPLSSILGAVELMRTPIPEADRAEYLEILQREVVRLDETLTELLDYASAQPRRGSCSWIEVWGRVEKLLSASLPRGLVLEASRESEILAVSGAHLQQVLMNLVKNAARATQLEGAGSPPTVRVTLAQEDGRAALTVEDNGPGIPQEMLPRLFAPFATSSVGGTGLGLATVRRLAELYGGRAWAENLDRGARFVVDLPITRPPAGASRGGIL